MVQEDIAFTTFDGDTITKNELRTELIEEYVAASYDEVSKVTDFTTGSEALHLSDVAAGKLLEFIQMIDNNYLMAMIHTMVGEFLDNHGDMVGCHRIASGPSTGEVTFTRLDTDDTSTEIIIPDGVQVATDDAISFLVDTDEETVSIPIGATSVTVECICEQEGGYTNVDPHTIIHVFDDNLGNKVSVDNISKFTGGTDIEDDDTYRNRILLAPGEAPAGTEAWHNNVALTLDSIHDVSVNRPGVGSEYDLEICYNPVNREDTVIDENTGVTVLKATYDIEGLFNLPEYHVVGINILFTLSTLYTVLESNSSTIEYYYAILTKQGYNLDDLKPAIINKIIEFNQDALVDIEFNPGNLASLIENEVTGIASCRIVAYDVNNDSWSEVVSPIEVPHNQVYHVDIPDNEYIEELQFNLDITPADEGD